MQITTVSPKVYQLYSNLSMVEACELHERLNQGKTDLETRRRLRAALRKSGLHRSQEWR